jgi:hypothetical protein
MSDASLSVEAPERDERAELLQYAVKALRQVRSDLRIGRIERARVMLDRVLSLPGIANVKTED